MTRNTKTQRLAIERLTRNLRALQDERDMDYAVRDLCPDAWRTLELDLDTEEKKVQMTIRLDESVARFYRAMGRGYQTRINRILATWAQIKIARVKTFEAEFDEWQRTGRGPWDREE